MKEKVMELGTRKGKRFRSMKFYAAMSKTVRSTSFKERAGHLVTWEFWII